jgi:hypothetical protein
VRLLSSPKRWASIGLLSIALAYAWPMQVNGWNQNAHWALVRALADGVPYVDRTAHEIGDLGTGDVAHHGRHLYASKAPGLALATVPWYLAVRATGVRTTGDPTRPVWYLTLWGAALPAALLVACMWWLADQFEPGLGFLTAAIVGLGTMVLSFATLFFSHSLSTFLGFAPFALLWRERRGPPRLALVAAAGLLIGFAFAVEYQVGFGVGIPLALYALRMRAPIALLKRASAFICGAVIGAVPNFAFNWWAFGSPFHTVYKDYSREHPGYWTSLNPYSLHPKFHIFTEMLFSALGLFTLAPVLLLGFVGLVLMARRGLVAEALVCAGVCLIIGVYQSGLGAFFGLGPPRYLMTLVPYLGLPIVMTLRRLPLTTLALAAISIFQTAVQAATGPLAAYDGQWLDRARGRMFMLTAASIVNVTGWYTISIFFLAVATGLVCAYIATRRLSAQPREWPWVALGIGAWTLIALRTWNPHGLPPSTRYVVATAFGAAIVAVAVQVVERRRVGRVRVLVPDAEAVA